jgi:hypothetical protein
MGFGYPSGTRTYKKMCKRTLQAQAMQASLASGYVIKARGYEL